MMARFPIVPFHENGRAYTWHIPSGEVRDSQGRLATDHKCVTLDVARRRVRRR